MPAFRPCIRTCHCYLHQTVAVYFLPARPLSHRIPKGCELANRLVLRSLEFLRQCKAPTNVLLQLRYGCLAVQGVRAAREPDQSSQPARNVEVSNR